MGVLFSVRAIALLEPWWSRISSRFGLAVVVSSLECQGMDRLLLIEVLRWCPASVAVLSRATTWDGDDCIPLGLVEDKQHDSA